MKTVVYFEQSRPHALELIGRAASFSAEVQAVCESSEDCTLALRAGANGALCIGVSQDDCAQGDRIAAVLPALHADSVLFSATVRGRFLSAWVAAKLQTGLTADCTSLGITEEGLLLQSRPAFGGNLTADILCRTHRPQMASVRPGVFPLPGLHTHAQGKAERLDPPALAAYLHRRGFTPAHNIVSLQEADIIVAGGKGVGSKKGFEKLFRIARLAGGAVGATRSAVDAGYIPYAHQIGQTGVAVRPKLYIGFGISGFIQHTVGMSSAKTVIAVNRDRQAPIFRHADYGIVSDWEAAADEIISALETQK